MRQVFIDGHNAIERLRLRGGDHRDRRLRLLRIVRGLGNDPTVFFDARGAPPDAPITPREEGVRVVYCRDREADAEMIEWVLDQVHPHRVSVVTDDREVAARARQHGARGVPVARYFRPFLEADEVEDDEKPQGRGGYRAEDFGLPEVIDLDDPPDL